MNRKSIHAAWVLLLVVGGLAWLFFKGAFIPPAPPGGQGPAGYVHLRWGNPSGATTNESDRNNYLMEKPYFALSYNNANGTPNWVSWRLAKEDLGHSPRNLQFQPDEDLPGGFKKVMPEDYTGSGFDRGHMCPYGDRESTEESRKATFVMTNAVPQSPADNRKGWEKFESYCRSLASEDKELYIVSGPNGQGGAGSKGPKNTLHGKNGDIVVPAVTWKVVMVLGAGAAPGPDMRLIAVVMPNDETVDENWGKYRTSVKAVEKRTGYTFFDRVDPSLIGPLKEKIDDGR